MRTRSCTLALLGAGALSIASMTPAHAGLDDAAAQALLKKDQKLWDGASVADILHWAHDAALLGGDDGGQAVNAVASWASGVAWSQFKAIKAVPPGDAAALDRACRDAWASARQAQLVGGNAPTAEDIVSACHGTGSAS